MHLRRITHDMACPCIYSMYVNATQSEFRSTIELLIAPAFPNRMAKMKLVQLRKKNLEMEFLSFSLTLRSSKFSISWFHSCICLTPVTLGSAWSLSRAKKANQVKDYFRTKTFQIAKSVSCMLERRPKYENRREFWLLFHLGGRFPKFSLEGKLMNG